MDPSMSEDADDNNADAMNEEDAATKRNSHPKSAFPKISMSASHAPLGMERIPHNENLSLPPDDRTCHDHHHHRRWMALLLGQCIALIAASMNVSSYTLTDKYSIHTPLFQLFWMYLLLSFHLFLRGNPRGVDSDEDDSIQQPQPISQYDEHEVEEEKDENIDTCEPFHTNDMPVHDYHFPLFPRFRLRIPWWKYLAMSVLDVTPNFMTLISYR
jgi:hypothetical protein